MWCCMTILREVGGLGVVERKMPRLGCSETWVVLGCVWCQQIMENRSRADFRSTMELGLGQYCYVALD